MEPATGIAAVIEAISAVVTGVITWIGSYMGAIMNPDNALLMVFFNSLEKIPLRRD